jgi:predicted alpha/beta-fold hydrolase
MRFRFLGGQIISSPFRPHGLLNNTHVQTIWPALIRKTPKVVTFRERLTTTDNDFLELDWLEQSERPLILLIHGLASSSKAKYMLGLQNAFQQRGYASVAMNLRGCGGQPNRKAKSYHAGVSDDLELVVSSLRRRFPKRPIGALGFSLGANVLLNWLADYQHSADLFAAASVSAPLQLNLATQQLQQGFAKLYGQYLLAAMKQSHREKLKYFIQTGLTDQLEPLTRTPSVRKIKTIADFDEHITAPLHGFKNAQDYYQKASAKHKLRQIHTPTLILHAEDDPFMPPEILPTKAELSNSVAVEVSPYGGHVGFVSADPLGRPTYWLETRIPDFFDELLNEAKYHKPGYAAFAYPDLGY